MSRGGSGLTSRIWSDDVFVFISSLPQDFTKLSERVVHLYSRADLQNWVWPITEPDRPGCSLQADA